MMNPVVKAKWLKALRSGEYKQARGSLKKGNSFCCLGVLCDLHAKETGGRWCKIVSEDTGGLVWGYESETSYLPLTVSTWAGLRGNLRGRLPSDYSLAELNDGDPTIMLPKQNFKTIADEIEAAL